MRSTHNRLIVLALTIATGVSLSGCALQHLPSLAKESAVERAVGQFANAQECLADRVAEYPAGEDVTTFASTLGPCVNVYLLDKTDQEILESFGPGGSGTWLVQAVSEGDGAKLVLMTVGAGIAIAGAWSEHHTILVCWKASIDFATRTIGEPTDAGCKPEAAQSWGKPKDVMTISELEAASE